MTKQVWLSAIFLALFVLISPAQAAIKSTTLPIKEMSQETRECVKCHQKNNPGLVQE